MGIFDNIAGLFGRGKRDGFKDVVNRVSIGGVSSRAGVAVTTDKALQLSAVFGCVRVIAEGVAQTPLHLYRAAPDGTRAKALDHPFAALIAAGPNKQDTFFQFIETMALHAALTGNAFAVLFRGVKGNLTAMLPVRPEHVEIINDGTGEGVGDVRYRIRLNGRTFEAQAQDVWHVRGPTWGDASGLEIVAVAREAIGLGIATESFAATLFSQGARPGGILSVPDFLEPEKQAEFASAWRSAYEGSSKAMSTMLLHGNAKFESLSMTSDEAQFIETRRFMIEEVCRFFRVLPIMVGSADKVATYSSSEQMFIAHVVHTMLPWFRRFESSMNKSLLTQDDIDAGLYFRFNVSGLLRGSAIDRANFYSRALGAGGSPAWMTQDEVRELEELNPLGGDAAKLPTPSNTNANINTGGGPQ